ncbi:MAG: SDR family oxidoreductase [Bacteroidota bacterium]
MIIITGASGGIGNSIIEELSKRDTILCLYHSSKPADLFKNDRTEPVQLDITNEADVKKFISDHRAQFKNITLVHFATVNIDGLVMTFDFADWKKIMDVNVNGNFLLTSNLLPLMIAGNWGRIIHISSVVGKNGMKGAAAYSASKTALEGWSRSLSKEYGRFNITSNILNLGYFEVGLINHLNDSDREKIIKDIPSQKLGKTSNIINAIYFLMDSEYVNGALIDIHGGL